MPMLRSYVHRVRETLRYYFGGVYRQMNDKDVFLWAQAISFKVLITVVPVIILMTGIVGTILRGDAFARVARIIGDYLPSSEMSRQLIQFLDRLQDAGTFLSALGILALLFSAVTLFTTLRIVIGNVFQEEWHRHRTLLGGYLFDVRMVLQVGLLFLLTFGLTVVTQSITEGGLEMAQRFGLDYVWLREGWRRTFKFLALLIPYLLSTAMFFQLFFFVPKPRPPKRSALLGAVVTGLLWEVAKKTFALYATSAGRFDRYRVPGEGGDYFAALGDAFVLIIAFVFWAYYSAIVLIIGALIAVLNEKRHRLRQIQKQEPDTAAAAASASDREDVEPHAESSVPDSVPEEAERDVTL